MKSLVSATCDDETDETQEGGGCSAESNRCSLFGFWASLSSRQVVIKVCLRLICFVCGCNSFSGHYHFSLNIFTEFPRAIPPPPYTRYKDGMSEVSISITLDRCNCCCFLTVIVKTGDGERKKKKQELWVTR